MPAPDHHGGRPSAVAAPLERLVNLQTALDTGERAVAVQAANACSTDNSAGWATLLLGRAALREDRETEARSCFETAAAQLGPQAEPWITQAVLDAGQGRLAADAVRSAEAEGSLPACLAALVQAVRSRDETDTVATVRHLEGFAAHPAAQAARAALSAWREPGGTYAAAVMPPDLSGTGIGSAFSAAGWSRDAGSHPSLSGLAWRLCAELFHAAGKPEDAASCLMHAAVLVPWRLDWLYAAAAALIRQNKTNALAPFWNALPVCFPGAPRWRMIRCFARWWTGAPLDKIQADWQAARILAPGWWPPNLAEACILTERVGVEMAEIAFTRYWQGGLRRLSPSAAAINAVPRRMAARTATLAPLPAVWNDIGVVRFMGGRFEEAADAFRRALALDPMQRHAATNLAVTIRCQGDGKALEAYLRRPRFSTTPPKALLLEQRPGGLDPAVLEAWQENWRASMNPAEWRRTTVFSQCWWRALADEAMGLEAMERHA